MNAAVDIEDPITIGTADRLGIGELNRPKAFNCLTRQMLSGNRPAFESFERTDVRAVVIVAAGKNICAGAALDEVEIARANSEQLHDFLAHGLNAFKERRTPRFA